MTKAIKHMEPCRHGSRLKTTYRSQAQANKARIKLASKNPSMPPMRVYSCPACGYYHLTKQL